MTKGVGIFINLSETWELNYFLKKNNYSQTEENRKKLTKIIKDKIKPFYRLESSQNLTWNNLDSYYNDNTEEFSELYKNDENN